MLNDRRNERRIGHEGHVPDDGLRREPKGEKGNKEKRGKKKTEIGSAKKPRRALYRDLYRGFTKHESDRIFLSNRDAHANRSDDQT